MMEYVSRVTRKKRMVVRASMLLSQSMLSLLFLFI